jgi:hypothetical protein
MKAPYLKPLALGRSAAFVLTRFLHLTYTVRGPGGRKFRPNCVRHIKEERDAYNNA